MQVALVNNGTKNADLLRELLNGHTVHEFQLEDALQVLDDAYDLIVLSGSSRFPIMYNLDILAGELELIRQTKTPLLGICFGAELMAVAYGGTLRDMGEKLQGVFPITIDVQDPLFNDKTVFDVYQAHRWSIDQVPDVFEILASSPTGPEVIRHRTKPQYGYQFHPEKMRDESDGTKLFNSFLARVF